MVFLKTIKHVANLVGILIVFVLGAFFSFFVQSHSFTQESSITTTDVPKPSEMLYISQPLNANIKIMPSFFSSQPTLTASSLLSSKQELTSDDRAAIAELFSKITERVAKETFCSGGSYDVSPDYRYDEGQRRIVGFSLHSALRCTIDKSQVDSYAKLLHDIDLLCSQSGYVLLNIPALEADYYKGHDNFKAYQRKMYQDILLQADALAKDYSSILNKTCHLQKLDFAQNHRLPQAKFLSADSPVQNAKVSLPVIEDGGKDFTTSANALLECL